MMVPSQNLGAGKKRPPAPFVSAQEFDNTLESLGCQKFFIFYNGEVTEGNYFRDFIEAFRNKNKVQFVKLRFTHGSPEQVVEQAQNFIDPVDSPDDNGDIVWLVFDKDDFDEQGGQYTETIKEVQTQSWSVAYSNECFELWLLLHFQDVAEPQYGTRRFLADKLTAIRSSYTTQSVNRTKNFSYGLLLKHGSKEEAARRATELHEAAIQQNASEPWNVCPVTSVHLLMDALKRFLTNGKE